MEIDDVGGGMPPMQPPEPSSDEPMDVGGGSDVSADVGGGEVAPSGGASSAGDASSDSSGSSTTEVQRQLQQDSFEPAADQRGADDSKADASRADDQRGQQRREEAVTMSARPRGERAMTMGASRRQEEAATMGAPRRSDPVPSRIAAAPRTLGSQSTASPRPAPAPAQTPAQVERQRDRFEVNMSPENRAHLQRQAGEISQKWNQFTGWAQRSGDWFRNNVPGVKQLNDLGGAAGDFAGTWGMRGAQAVGADKWQVPEQVKEKVLDAADAVTRPVLQNRELMDSAMTQERFTYGVGMEAAGTVEGMHTLATNPGEVARGLGNAAMHPIQTGQAIGGELQKQWNKDPVETLGRGAFEIGSFFLPGAKAGDAAKAGEVAEHVAQAGRVANEVEKVSEVSRGATLVEDAARAGTGVERTAETARAATGAERAGEVGEAARDVAQTASRAEEVGSAGSKLASGSEEYNALRASVEAKEELARRLRDSVPGGRNEIPPGARGHAMSGAAGGASQEQIAGQAAKLEKEAAAGRKALEEADSAAEAVKAATPRNVWIENPKDFPHKINGSKPSRAMMNDNGTVRYQWLDEQKRVVQESAVLKDGRVTWGQAESGLIDVPAGARPGHTPNPITGAPAGNEIRGHFTPYEMTADVSNSGANMGKQSVIMNGTNPYRGLEEAAVEFGKDNPGKGAKYLVISKADQAGVETARRQVLWMRPPEGGRVIKEFDRTTQAINDASHPLQRALETSRQPKVKAPAAAPVAPPAAAPAGPAALPAPPVRAALPAPPARAALPAPH